MGVVVGEAEAGEVGARKTPREHLGEEEIVLYMQALCDKLQMVCRLMHRQWKPRLACGLHGICKASQTIHMHARIGSTLPAASTWMRGQAV